MLGSSPEGYMIRQAGGEEIYLRSQHQTRGVHIILHQAIMSEQINLQQTQRKYLDLATLK